MIAAQPTKQNLQLFWEQDPLAFHTSPMPGFEEQGLSAAQWALLTQPTQAFWGDKSRPNDADLWAWAVDNTRNNAATVDIMARLGVPVAPDTLVRLLLRSAGSDDTIAYATMSFAAQHHLAWTTEKDKTSAPELLASPKNIAYLAFLDTEKTLLDWKKPSTGNGLLHSAVLYKAKATIAAFLGKGASQAPNNAGITPIQMAQEELVAWPSSFGNIKKAASNSEHSTNPTVATPPTTARTPSGKKRSGASSSEQMGLF